MKILLNGATGGTNFGDFLFAKIFQDAVSEKIGIENVFWYNSRYCLSDFYKEHLKFNKKKYKLNDITALVCISGGYFCGDDKNFKDYIIRYLRYFHLCLKCIKKNIPIAIIGMDVAKPKIKLMEMIQKYILKRATLLTVRNIESYNLLVEYGIKNVYCGADTALSIKKDLYENEIVPDDIKNIKNKKLYFHVQLSCIDGAEKQIAAINNFLRCFPDYSVIIGTDQYIENYDMLQRLSNKILCKEKIVYRYNNPIELCKVLTVMDCIVTPKLHIGIIGALFSKSVISFSVHTEKIKRFYEQIGESGRSLSMAEFDVDRATDILKEYHDKTIQVPKTIIEKAEMNLERLGGFIDELSNKKDNI